MTFNKNDASGSSIVPNHWKHWMTAFQQDATCVSHWWEQLLVCVYGIDYIHYLPTTTKYQPEMPDYVNNNDIAIRYLATILKSTRYQVSKRKTGREINKEIKKMKHETKTNIMRSGSRPSPEGTRLLFAGGTVSPIYDVSCWWTTEGRRKRPDGGQAQDEGRDKAEKNKSRQQRGGGFSLNLYLPGISRWSGVISHDLSWYIVISYPISCHITRYDISRYCIHVPNF